MKRWIPWGAALAVVGLLGAGIARIVDNRRAEQQALTQSQAVGQDAVVELADTDLVTARVRTLTQELAVSGALKAVNTAVVRTRVAGELQGLTIREGDAVKAGQWIARIDASEYAARGRQANQLAASSKAQVDVAQRQFDNNQALVDRGFISKTALEVSLANLNAARASYQAALAGADVAGKSVQDTVLRAPIDGQVSQRLAQPGERLGIDARVVEIVDLRQLELEASLSPADGAQVRVGQTAILRVEGQPQTVTARVVRINPSAQAGSRSVVTYLAIDTPAGGNAGLRQGLFAQGHLATVRTDAVAVPLSSVRTDKPTPYVQTVELRPSPGGSVTVVAHRNVSPGPRGKADGETVVAVTGLADQAQVVRGTAGALREGARVRMTALPAPGAAIATRPAP